MTVKILASCLLLAATATAETSVSLAAGQLKSDVIQMGRDGRVLTLALKITNVSKDADAFILLFGEPSAFDDPGAAGTSFNLWWALPIVRGRKPARRRSGCASVCRVSPKAFSRCKAIPIFSRAGP